MKIKLQVKNTHIKRGRQKVSSSCPIALSIVAAGFVEPSVDSEDISFSTKKGLRIEAKSSKAVARFVENFDEKGRESVKPMTIVLDV